VEHHVVQKYLIIEPAFKLLSIPKPKIDICVLLYCGFVWQC
jgi:hypothetical protein